MNILNLKKLYPNATVGIFEVLETELNKETWSDDNKMKFLAQCAHESGYFRRLVENLNYSLEGLIKVFPKYFKYGFRDPYEYRNKPQKIANIVYANRLGNGNEKSGDGWKYRGRGLIQITGKANYDKCLAALGRTEPEYLETVEGAVRSAIWYWKVNLLYNEQNMNLITKRINGGYNGLEDRINQYKRIKQFAMDLTQSPQTVPQTEPKA